MSKGGKQTTENKVDPRLMGEFWGTLGQYDSATSGGRSFVPDLSGDTEDYFAGARSFTGSGDQLRDIGGRGPYLLGDAQGYTPGTYSANTYDAGQAADVGDVGDIAASQASKYIKDYMSPYTRDVVDTSLADYDTGVDRAISGRAASADAGSAFGNRRAIADAIYEADASRGRGALSANLRNTGFTTALGAATGDANRFLSADMANQGTQSGNLDRRAQLGAFNVGQRNTASANNMLALNNAAQFNTGAANDASRFGADFANRFAIGNQSERGAADLRNIEALRGADAATMGRLGLLGDAGARQDAFNYDRAQEPLNLLRQRLGYLSGIPVQQTTTSRTNPGLMGMLGGLGTAAFGLGSLGWNPFGGAASGVASSGNLVQGGYKPNIPR